MSPVRLCIHKTQPMNKLVWKVVFERCSSTITQLLNFTVWTYLHNLVWKWYSWTELWKWNKVFPLGTLKPHFLIIIIIIIIIILSRKSQIRVRSPWPWLAEGGRQRGSSNRFLKCTRVFTSNPMEIQTTRNFGNRETRVTGWNPHWLTK